MDGFELPLDETRRRRGRHRGRFKFAIAQRDIRERVVSLYTHVAAVAAPAQAAAAAETRI